MASKRYLTESIRRIMAGGDPRSSFQVKDADIHASMGRAINALLKMEAVNFTYPFGTSIPTHHLIATFEGVEVVDDPTCKRSYAILPATPITLPMQLGVWRISNCDCDFFVPLEPGMLNVASRVSHTPIAAMLGSEITAYEVAGSKVTFNRTKEQLGETVDIQLLTSDINDLDEYSQLPLPPDLELRVVEMVVRELQQRPHDDSNDANDKP